jgi:hypothetical protein
MTSIDRIPTTRPAQPSGEGLADILERILDRGLVVAGDIQVTLLDIELLTIKIRLLLASADTARSMGIDWWQSDAFLSSDASELKQENDRLRARLEQLERIAGVQQLPRSAERADEE